VPFMCAATDLGAARRRSRAARDRVCACKGYRVRRKDHGDHQVIAAMNGTANRLG